MKAKITEYAVTIIGLLLLAAGLCLLKMNGTPQGIMFALPLCMYWYWMWPVWSGHGKYNFRTGCS